MLRHILRDCHTTARYAEILSGLKIYYLSTKADFALKLHIDNKTYIPNYGMHYLLSKPLRTHFKILGPGISLLPIPPEVTKTHSNII